MQVDVGGALEAIEVPLVAPGSRVVTPDVQLPLGLTFEGVHVPAQLHERTVVLGLCYRFTMLPDTKRAHTCGNTFLTVPCQFDHLVLLMP